MATFTIQTTKSIYTEPGSTELANVCVGDIILTSGFYAAGDGGAAKFIVQTGTADNYFSHAINGCPGLIASLVLEDGVVNVDQLGAKEFGIIYTPFEVDSDFFDVGVCSEAEKSAKLSELYSFSSTLMNSVNSNSTVKENTHKNADIIAAAIANPDVRELRFTGGKVYGVQSRNATYSAIRIQERSDFTLNGCGATIQALYQRPCQAICVNISTGHRASNIRIENMTLRGLCYEKLNPNEMINQGIFTQKIDGLYIHNVQIENFRYGVRINDSNTNVFMDNLVIRNTFTGMQLTDINGGSLTDSYISCEWNNLLAYGDAKVNHGIYATGIIQNYAFSRLAFRNIGEGNAINRNGGSVPSTNLLFSDIIIDRARRAFNLGANTHNTMIQNVHATKLRYAGFQLKGVQSLRMSDCNYFGDETVFVTQEYAAAHENNYDDILDRQSSFGFVISDDSEAGTQNTDQTAYIENIMVENCRFVFPQHFFLVGQNRYANSRDIQFSHCVFNIHVPLLSKKLTPAYIKGIVSDIRFYRCRFETDGFTSTDHSRNGVFFYFDSALSTPNPYTNVVPTPNPMHWLFEKCEFINRGTVSVNSAFLSFSNNDGNNKVFCAIHSCVLEGFRWTIRVASTIDATSSILNPCFYDMNPSERSAAAAKLHQRKRFLSKNNLFCNISAEYCTYQYLSAEEFGA